MTDHLPGVVLQDPRHFSVKITDARSGEARGTGIVVSIDGRIVTCGHVVQQAGFDPRTGQPTGALARLWAQLRGIQPLAQVGVDFAESTNKPDHARRANVLGCLAEYGDDVVLLQLADPDPIPLGPERLPRWSTASGSRGHTFSTFGFRRLGKNPGNPGLGRIAGASLRAPDSNLYADPILIESEHVDHGMSGAALLDDELNLVVGVIAAKFDGSVGRDEKTNFAIDAAVLVLEPFGVLLEDGALALQPGPEPRVPPSGPGGSGWALHGAPDGLLAWQGRYDELLLLADEALRARAAHASNQAQQTAGTEAQLGQQGFADGSQSATDVQ